MAKRTVEDIKLVPARVAIVAPIGPQEGAIIIAQNAFGDINRVCGTIAVGKESRL